MILHLLLRASTWRIIASGEPDVEGLTVRDSAAQASTRAAHFFLALASSTVVWILCTIAPILASFAVLLAPVIAIAIWEIVTGRRMSSETFGIVVGTVMLLATVALMLVISTAIVRLSLRLSPLPIARPSRLSLTPTLWLSWLLVVIALVASDAEWIVFMVTALIGICAVGRACYFRYHWNGFPRGPMVLFLRRFGRTADRIVSTAVRRAVPEGMTLALLVGARQGAASWDPLVVSFDGMRATGVVHYLQSTDADWVHDVTQLVSRADAVVLDATDWSEAMDTELSIVEACGAADRLIVLTRQSSGANHIVSTRQQLRYGTSWRQGEHRMIWGFFLTFLPAIVGEDAGWSLRTRVVATVPAVLAWLLLAVRPLMDAEATDDLTRRLAAIRSSRLAEGQRS